MTSCNDKLIERFYFYTKIQLIGMTVGFGSFFSYNNILICLYWLSYDCLNYIEDEDGFKCLKGIKEESGQLKGSSCCRLLRPPGFKMS